MEQQKPPAAAYRPAFSKLYDDIASRADLNASHKLILAVLLRHQGEAAHIDMPWYDLAKRVGMNRNTTRRAARYLAYVGEISIEGWDPNILSTKTKREQLGEMVQFRRRKDKPQLSEMTRFYVLSAAKRQTYAALQEQKALRLESAAMESGKLELMPEKKGKNRGLNRTSATGVAD